MHHSSQLPSTHRRTLAPIVALVTGLLACSPDAHAAERRTVQSTAADEAVAKSNREFAGFSFGAGFSVTLDTGSRRRVEDALIDEAGVVRASTSNDVRARVILESHYLFPLQKTDAGEYLRRGWGPFLAIQPGDEEVIKAIGAGVMVAFRRDADASTQSFNLGIGFIVDPSEKILGEEFEVDQAAPVGSGGAALPIRYETRDQGGVLLMASFAW